METRVVLVNERSRLRVVRPCCVCGAEFSVQPSKVARHKSCLDCRSVNRKPPVTIACVQCGESFVRKGHLGGIQRFCSIQCRWKSVRPDDLPESRPCLECGSAFRPTVNRRLYCSQACHAASVRRQDRECGWCGLAFNAKRHRAKGAKVYCSRRCKADATVGPNHPLWVEVRPVDDRGPGWEALAESIRERDGRSCQRCGAGETDRRLDVHHVEPYRVARNNHPDNLVSLCASCHKVVEHSPWLLSLAGTARPGTTPA